MSVKWIIRIIILIILILAIGAAIVFVCLWKAEKSKSKNVKQQLERALIENYRYQTNLEQIETYMKRSNDLEREQTKENEEFKISSDRRSIVCNAMDRLYND